MRGLGKIILFGEHAVVYGYPALATSIETGIDCIVKDPDSKEFHLSIPAWNLEVSPNDSITIAQVMQVIQNELGQPLCSLLVKPNMPSRAGLGSSAAFSTAIIKTLLEFQKKTWTLEQINDLAYKAETIFHGTPSGIDNTVANYGGFCYLCDTQKYSCPDQYILKTISLPRGNAFLLPPLKKSPSFVIINTEKERETKEIVSHVRNLLQKNPTQIESIMQKIGDLSLLGYEALLQEDYKKLAQLMNENQEYLRSLDVSCPEIENVIQCAMNAGAWAGKLTGAGRGGCVIIFAPGHEQDVLEECKRNKFPAFMTKIGV